MYIFPISSENHQNWDTKLVNFVIIVFESRKQDIWFGNAVATDLVNTSLPTFVRNLTVHPFTRPRSLYCRKLKICVWFPKLYGIPNYVPISPNIRISNMLYNFWVAPLIMCQNGRDDLVKLVYWTDIDSYSAFYSE